MNYDLDKFGLSEEELFSPVDNGSWSLRRYGSEIFLLAFRVRVFLRKINIAVLCLLGVILLMTYVSALCFG